MVPVQLHIQAPMGFDEELAKARLLQKMLLPASVPDIAGAKLGYLYEPAHILSGDFLDFYYKKNTRELGFFICDVSGHGIHAAIIAAMTKMALHLWGDYLHEPRGTLQKIARQLRGKVVDEYLTAIMGYLDLRTGVMKLARAGHPPAFILRNGTAKIEKVNPNGTIIHDAIPDMTVEWETRLSPGDEIFLYTDGLTEYVDDRGNSLGEEGLENLLTAVKAPSDPDALCNNVFNEVIRRKINDQAPLLDDVTLFAIQFTGR